MVKHPADQGGKWIRPKKRYQIYKRDGLRCIYCLKTLGPGFSLDHIVPISLRIDNDSRNLVTCCSRCNGKRADMSIEKFMVYLVREHHQSPHEVRKRLLVAKHSKLPHLTDEEMQSIATILKEAKDE